MADISDLRDQFPAVPIAVGIPRELRQAWFHPSVKENDHLQIESTNQRG